LRGFSYVEPGDRDATFFVRDPPLFQAISSEAAKLLVEKGANVNFADEKGFTPLLAAVGHKRIDIALALLDAGADPNAKLSDGKTALHMGGWGNDPRVVDKLVEKGADLNAKDKFGRTPLWRLVTYHRDADIGRLLPKNPSVNITGPLKTTDTNMVPFSKLVDIMEDELTPLTVRELKEAIARGDQPASPTVTGSTGNPSNLTTPASISGQSDGAPVTPISVTSQGSRIGEGLAPGQPTTLSDAQRSTIERQVVRNPVTGKVVPTPKPVGTVRAEKGGKSRKRTLKKRRVGKQNVRGSRHR
jgi:hypothetical protein